MSSLCDRYKMRIEELLSIRTILSCNECSSRFQCLVAFLYNICNTCFFDKAQWYSTNNGINWCLFNIFIDLFTREIIDSQSRINDFLKMRFKIFFIDFKTDKLTIRWELIEYKFGYISITWSKFNNRFCLRSVYFFKDISYTTFTISTYSACSFWGFYYSFKHSQKVSKNLQKKIIWLHYSY